MPSNEGPPEPWRSFFAEVDRALHERVSLHCCGGFVVTQLYGVARATSDIDFLDAVPNVSRYLLEVAGRGSGLHRKHHVYLDAVTVATPPVDYQARMAQFCPGMWQYLRLCGLEAHDIVSVAPENWAILAPQMGPAVRLRNGESEYARCAMLSGLD